MYEDIWFSGKNDRMEKQNSNQERIFQFLEYNIHFHPSLPRSKQFYIFFKRYDRNKILSAYIEFKFQGNQ